MLLKGIIFCLLQQMLGMEVIETYERFISMGSGNENDIDYSILHGLNFMFVR